MGSGSFVTVDGGRIAVARAGAGPALLFLHNAGTCRQIWDAQLRHFATSHTVVAFDFPGYGESDPPTRDYTIDYCTDVAERVIAENHLEDITVVGNCIGAATALRLSVRQPTNVRGVLAVNVLTNKTAAPGLLGPLAALGVRSPAARRATASIAQRVPMPRWLAKLYVRAQVADTTRADPTIIEHLVARWQRPVNSASLLRLRTDTFTTLVRQTNGPPVHLVWGQHNRILPARGAGEVSEAIGAERFRILTGTGHLPMVEHPGEIIDAIEELLSAAPPRRLEPTP